MFDRIVIYFIFGIILVGTPLALSVNERGNKILNQTKNINNQVQELKQLLVFEEEIY
jgi:hypothetical protein